MRFERGADIKEILDIGLITKARKIVNVRFILLESGMEADFFQTSEDGFTNNVETCLHLSDEYIHKILRGMEEGTFVHTQLLEITEKMPPIVTPNGDQDYHKFHLGKDMRGEILKYKGKLYIIKK